MISRAGSIHGFRPARYASAHVLTAAIAVMWWPFLTSFAAATCSYDLNGVGYGDNCPYRGPVAPAYRPPIYYYHPPPVYVPPQPVGPSPAQIAAQQRKTAGHNANESGVAASKRHNWAAAIADFRRALQLWPDNNVIRHNLEMALASQANIDGLAASRRGDYAAAAAAFRQALAQLPGNATIKGNLAEAQDNLNHQHQIASAKPKIAAILDAPLTTATTPAPGNGLAFLAAPAVDPIATGVPPMPDLASLKWHHAFPTDTAAVALSQNDLDKLAAAGTGARSWLGAKLISAAKGHAKDAAIGQTIARLPIADALKDEAHWQEGMVERYKGLYQDVSTDTKNYLLGFASVTQRAATCLGSGSTSSCGAEQADVQVLANRYGDQSSNRWKSWVSDDIKAHLSRFFDAKP